MAIMCHASWHFPELRWLIDFMEEAGSGRVCIADSIPTKNRSKAEFYRNLGIIHESINRFDLLHKTISSFNRIPNTRTFSFTMRRSTESAISMLTQVLSKYRKPSMKDLRCIERYVFSHATSYGIYEEELTMGMLWWHTVN